MNWDKSTKLTVSTRNFPFLVMATSSLIEIPLLVTLLPIVDGACFRKVLLYVFGFCVVGSSGLMFFLCRESTDYSLMAWLCVALGTSLTLHNAISDVYLPLLTTSNIDVARALALAPAKPIKDKKKKKKKKKTKKKKKEKNTKKSIDKPPSESGSQPSKSSSTRDSKTSEDIWNKAIDISRKPVPLQHRYTRIQDQLAGRSAYYATLHAFGCSIILLLWIWWYVNKL